MRFQQRRSDRVQTPGLHSRGFRPFFILSQQVHSKLTGFIIQHTRTLKGERLTVEN